MTHTILLIGAGNLGRRYFQGILKIKLKLNIFVNDINDVSLSKTKQILDIETKKIRNFSHKVFFKKKFKELPKIFDLIIISTNADTRLKIIEELI